jgi:hypothetical protein
MIQSRTVLVLGAGASVPYGFPSGEELRRKVLRSLGLKPEVPGSLLQLLNNAGFDHSHIQDFRTELLHANTTSVDLFLEKRPKFVDVGKVAIAAILLPLEADSLKTIFEPRPSCLRRLALRYSVRRAKCPKGGRKD